MGEFSPLLDTGVKEMISDCQKLIDHDYIVNEGMIGYKEQDAIEYDINFGYKTLFAYFHEIEITKKILPDCKKFLKLKRLLLKCGEFSYATIIREKFSFIMGVTGTLSTLNLEMINDLKNIYKVNKFSFMPPVYPESKLVFDAEKNIKILKENEHFKAIIDEISRVKKTDEGKIRPIIVVFENLKKLKEFLEYDGLKQYKQNTDCLTEEMNEFQIKKAVDEGTEAEKITLITKSFGRGIDFVIKDEEIEKNGGVHVIQTFYSSSLSEEIQIKGRAARQGDNGSYSLIIIDTTLNEFGMTEKILSTKTKKAILEELQTKRDEENSKEHIKNQESIRKVESKHIDSMNFLKSLYEGNNQKIREFLVRENQYKSTEFKTLILMDATGSMDKFLENAKNSVSKMFEQTNKVLKKNNYPEGFLYMKFVGYRNYNSPENELLQHSDWENSPDNIKKFLESIKCSGGWGNEAIEIALWYANQEDDLNQIILIGDAACNTKDEIKMKRDKEGEQYWSKTKFAKQTFWETELNLIKQKNIIIKAFYLKENAKNDFSKIANACNGTADPLDVNTDIKISSKSLTDSVTLEILKAINPNFAEEYKKTYMS